jgi:hypothetical protein
MIRGSPASEVMVATVAASETLRFGSPKFVRLKTYVVVALVDGEGTARAGGVDAGDRPVAEDGPLPERVRGDLCVRFEATASVLWAAWRQGRGGGHGGLSEYEVYWSKI